MGRQKSVHESVKPCKKRKDKYTVNPETSTQGVTYLARIVVILRTFAMAPWASIANLSSFLEANRPLVVLPAGCMVRTLATQLKGACHSRGVLLGTVTCRGMDKVMSTRDQNGT
jgi:hypothetical protein